MGVPGRLGSSLPFTASTPPGWYPWGFRGAANICGRDWSPADYPEHETTSHKIDADPKIPRGGTDLILAVHGVEHAEAPSTPTASLLRPRQRPVTNAA
jgi:hypothetical protein